MVFSNNYEKVIHHIYKFLIIFSMVIVQGKYDRGMNRTRAFTFRNFDFKYENGTKLEEFLTPEDRKTYSFDPKEIYWPRIIEQCARGVRDYFFRERCDGGDGLRRYLFI